MFNGDWQNAGYDKDMAGNVGFFLFPPAEAGGKRGRDVGAADLRHRRQRQERRLRRVLPQLGRHQRARPARSTSPSAARTRAVRPTCRSRRPPPGSVTNETLAAGADVAKDNGAMDFIANATGSIFAQGWTPELQKMVGGKQDAAGLLKAVQAEYEKELQPVSSGRRRGRPRPGDPPSSPTAAARSAAAPADPLASGDPPADLGRLAVRAAGPR